jgi:hypothetical protein
MRLRALSLVALASLAALTGCRRLRRRAAHHATPSATRWFVRAHDGDTRRVETGRYVRGALRFTDRAVAQGPHPATPITAAARLDGDLWLFASEDGTLYRSRGYDGPLTVIASLPARTATLPTRSRHVPFSRGALFVIDADRRAHTVDRAGTVRQLPFERVLAGAFTAPSELGVVVEPGELHASHDGGAHFALVDGHAGAVYDFSAEDDGTRIELAPTLSARRADPAHAAPPSPRPPIPEALDALLEREIPQQSRLPIEPSRIAQHPDGTLALVRDRELALLDATTLAVRRTVSLPDASSCTVHASSPRLRLVCTTARGSYDVFEEPTDPGAPWTLLRGESRGEPMSDALFDDRSPAWVIAAPCTADPTLGLDGEIDPRAACLYDTHGTKHDVRLPFDAVPVTMQRATALFVDVAASGAGGPTRALLVREDGAREVALPVGSEAARTGHFHDDTLAFWERDDTRLHYALGTLTPQGYTWKRVAAPEGARAGVHGNGGVAVAFGRHLHEAWQSTHGGPFRAIPSPVAGTSYPIAVADEESASYCVGAWCRLDRMRVLGPGSVGASMLVARGDAPPARRPEGPEHTARVLECSAEAAVATPPTDAYAFVNGHAAQVHADGSGLLVSWVGEAVASFVTVRDGMDLVGTVPPLHAVIGTTAPAAWIERCRGTTCAWTLIDRTRVVRFTLDDDARDVQVFARPPHYLVAWWTSAEPSERLTLAHLSERGELTDERVLVTLAAREDVHVGALDNHVGVWIEQPDGRMRFHALLRGGPSEVTDAPTASTALCDPAVTPRGELWWTGTLTDVRIGARDTQALAWEKHEHFLVTPRGVCLHSLEGGTTARLPATERVRGYAVSARAPGELTGTAWGNGLRIPLRCRAPNNR